MFGLVEMVMLLLACSGLFVLPQMQDIQRATVNRARRPFDALVVGCVVGLLAFLCTNSLNQIWQKR